MNKAPLKPIDGFLPIINQQCKVLVPGSMPSVQSLEQNFYYAHPRNAFWPIFARLFDSPLPDSIESKTSLLLANKVALWDVLKSCIRKGSLDSNIKAAEPNDFGARFVQFPNIRAVLFNGKTAQRLFLRLQPKVLADRFSVVLPSTSPAHTMVFEEKLNSWKVLLDCFDD